MKHLLVNFLIEHPDLSWEINQKIEEILIRSIEEFFEKYPEYKSI